MMEPNQINNEFYHDYGDRWYTAQDDPVALLRSESRFICPWVEQVIRKRHPLQSSVLDIGCGGGFLSNHLSSRGYRVTGIDRSVESLNVAKAFDNSKRATYLEADAYQLPFDRDSFSVVCAMDFLEHVEDPGKVIQEIARVLKPGGTFFFHTFNRNPISFLIAIKGVEWFVRNTPKNMHLYRLFIKPKELRQLCSLNKLKIEKMTGTRPKVNKAFFDLLRNGTVSDRFEFIETPSVSIGYLGWAKKEGTNAPSMKTAKAD